jgi:ribonuclease HII
MANTQLPNLEYESLYLGKIIAGLDEVGRGALSGPVVVAAVIVDRSHIITGIKDSKKLSIASRERLYREITSRYIWSVGLVCNKEIDRINILEATKKACIIAANNLNVTPDILLVDGNMKFADARFVSLVNGDNASISIAAASIVAKVTRDRLMVKYSQDFPEYLWDKNFGYGTKQHIHAIKLHGLSSHHRNSFHIKI